MEENADGVDHSADKESGSVSGKILIAIGTSFDIGSDPTYVWLGWGVKNNNSLFNDFVSNHIVDFNSSESAVYVWNITCEATYTITRIGAPFAQINCYAQSTGLPTMDQIWTGSNGVSIRGNLSISPANQERTKTFNGSITTYYNQGIPSNATNIICGLLSKNIWWGTNPDQNEWHPESKLKVYLTSCTKNGTSVKLTKNTLR